MRPDFDHVDPRLFVLRDGRKTCRVRTNERGFRTPSFEQSAPKEVIRIACLGDSVIARRLLREIVALERVRRAL